jgi:hypothetical protein
MDIKLDHLSKPRQKLVKMAEENGYNITQCGNNEIIIRKGKTARSKGVMIFEDGGIFRNGIEFSLIKPMTIKETETYLDI